MSEYRRVWFREKWHVRIGSGADARRISLRTTDPEIADRRIAQIRRDATRPSDHTVEWLWAAYVHEKQGRAILETMRHTWKALKPRFGHLQPDAITVDLCREHTESRRMTVSDGTIHTELGHLRMVLSWAQKRRLIEQAPHIERPSKPAPKDRWLSRDEARAVLDGAAMPHVRVAMVLMLATAARVGAVLSLTWDRVDFERGKIHLTDPADKTIRKERASVPMNGMARAALIEAQRGATTDYVIEWAGKPVASIKRGIATAAKNAGVEGISAHVFRHTAAVWMAEQNVPMPRIAQYLGHRDSKVTERVYARYSPDHLRSEADILDLGIWSAGSTDKAGTSQ